MGDGELEDVSSLKTCGRSVVELVGVPCCVVGAARGRGSARFVETDKERGRTDRIIEALNLSPEPLRRSGFNAKASRVC